MQNTRIFKRSFLDIIREINPQFSEILLKKEPVEKIREKILVYLYSLEERVLNDLKIKEYVRIQKIDLIKNVKNVMSKRSYNLASYDTLTTLIQLIKKSNYAIVNKTFVTEIIKMMSALYNLSSPHISVIDAQIFETKKENMSTERSDFLDECFGKTIHAHFNKYPWGLEKELIETRKNNKRRILKILNGNEQDWKNWRWHINHIVKTANELKKYISISKDEEKAINTCTKYRVPFGMTPYYISLMNPYNPTNWDIGIRTQVIPPLNYSQKMAISPENRSLKFDFMREHDTSPVFLVTRRYPQIAIFKPFNTCPQICVYCQRNWEIKEVMATNSLAQDRLIQNAVNWYTNHPFINEVLITGGDPGIMPDKLIDKIFGLFYEIPHIKRIRLATRVPATLPMRINKKFIKTLKKFHRPPYKEIYIVTHIENPTEITPEVVNAVQTIKNAGLSIYNQQVMTPYNTQRFKTAKLRWDLKMIGVDPYYAFYPKGKDETENYRIPIARVAQELKEEARLLPGNIRTDEPVFNVPFLGKNHLRAYQDRELIAIKPNGQRMYLMHSWEKNITSSSPYIYEDVTIDSYLDNLEKLGEKRKNYESIWYYY